MCWYHVTFHLDLELEHTLNVGSSGDYHVAICLREAIYVTSQKCLYPKTKVKGLVIQALL